MPLALSTNISMGWKGLPGTNTPSYLSLFISDEEKSLKMLTPGANVI